MSPSSDIETLFGHFGGNAGDYQEIGRENEASSARTRWPLLVTLDLTQPSIPAVPQRRDHANPALDAAQATDGETQAPAASAEAGRTATPQVRSKTPLFARAHRRSIPPVGQEVKVETPRGAERFSAIPEATQPEHDASGTQSPAVGTLPAAAAAPVPQAAPVAAFATAAIPPLSTPLNTPVSVPVATPPVVARTTFAAPAFRTSAPVVPSPVAPAAMPAPALFSTRAAAPAPAAFTPRAAAPMPAASSAARTAQPPSILGKLFTAAAPGSTPTARTPASEPKPAALGSLFDRLRGDTPTAATPTPYSWLNNGPRRS